MTRLLAALLVGVSSALAQSTDGTGPRPRKEAVAARVEAYAPAVDGRLDDPAWQSARFFSDFVQKQPSEGAEPTERASLQPGAALGVAPGEHALRGVAAGPLVVLTAGRPGEADLAV